MRGNITSEDLAMMVGPMEGVVTGVLARAANKLDLVPTWVTPFLRVSSQLYPDKFVKNFATPFQGRGKVIMQIMGNSPQLLSDTVMQIDRLKIVDGINLNFGCPSKKVMSGNCGGAALKDIDNICNIIQTIREKSPNINLSAKIRLGFALIEEMEVIIPRLVALNALDFLVVHIRSVAERYQLIEGHLERFKRVVKLARELPVVINGDIDSMSKGKFYVQESGAAGFMSARWWLKNPYIFCKELTTNSDRELFYKTVLDVAENEFKTPYSIGKKIELSNFIFGKDNPYFESLKAENAKIGKLN